MMQVHYLTAVQHTGIEKSFHHAIVADIVEEAEDWFVDGKERLLDVNNWASYCGEASAAFRLTDSHGHVVSRRAKKGDYIRIDVPGPGPSSGDGFDWVHIDAIEYDDYPDDDSESIAMRVKPCESPAISIGSGEFPSDEVASIFVITRTRRHVAADYFGNKEQNAEDAATEGRSSRFPATAAMLGLSDLQWNRLLRALIE